MSAVRELFAHVATLGETTEDWCRDCGGVHADGECPKGSCPGFSAACWDPTPGHVCPDVCYGCGRTQAEHEREEVPMDCE